MTHRLYHDDAYLRRFDAEVVAITTYRSRPAVVLDRTTFYPEAGGQLGDRGRLGELAVIDTQEADDGAIVHLIEGEPPAVGSRVTGELDWLRRRQHMAQHTAQHLLSGALLDRAQAPTMSARLGENSLTIDVARDRIPEAELAAAEDLANDLVDDDLLIRAWFPSAEELARLTLRRDPKVTADVRVVAIGEFDLSPCGGTHCARTSQLAAVRITGAERYKGMTRVTFTTARRGRAELFARDQVLRGLAGQFSCGPAEVPAAIDKLRRAAGRRGAAPQRRRQARRRRPRRDPVRPRRRRRDRGDDPRRGIEPGLRRAVETARRQARRARRRPGRSRRRPARHRGHGLAGDGRRRHGLIFARLHRGGRTAHQERRCAPAHSAWARGRQGSRVLLIC